MPVFSEIPAFDVEEYLAYFTDKYPTAEDRRVAAWILAEIHTTGLEATLPEEQNISRNTLLGHWGESYSGLVRVSQFIYPLTKALKAAEREPIMVFRKGSVDDIMSEDDSYEEVDIECGIIQIPRPRHAFAGNTNNK